MSSWWWFTLAATSVGCGMLLVGLRALSRSALELERQLALVERAEVRGVAAAVAADCQALRDALTDLPR